MAPKRARRVRGGVDWMFTGSTERTGATGIACMRCGNCRKWCGDVVKVGAWRARVCGFGEKCGDLPRCRFEESDDDAMGGGIFELKGIGDPERWRTAGRRKRALSGFRRESGIWNLVGGWHHGWWLSSTAASYEAALQRKCAGRNIFVGQQMRTRSRCIRKLPPARTAIAIPHRLFREGSGLSLGANSG